MGTWRQGRLSIPLLGILIILRLAPYAACFKRECPPPSVEILGK